ncbi:hypothetical protein WA026_021872 [Henosepilachna vigintioctopunctata]|uniref:Uncharacterized protein n=1 Tax=Henosepilachna vigintioctopunctata TaxID=420089 RepID=A0AAW1UN77_9CUCU
MTSALPEVYKAALQVGLGPNPNKCCVLSLVPLVKLRKIKVPKDVAITTLRLVECSNSEKSFDTRSGLGVYKYSEHKEDVNRELEEPSKNFRWNDEELRSMARMEASLVRKGEKFLNLALMRMMDGKTRESIQSVTRRTYHKKMVMEETTRIDTMVDECQEEDDIKENTNEN